MSPSGVANRESSLINSLDGPQARVGRVDGQQADLVRKGVRPGGRPDALAGSQADTYAAPTGKEEATVLEGGTAAGGDDQDGRRVWRRECGHKGVRSGEDGQRNKRRQEGVVVGGHDVWVVGGRRGVC